MNKFIIYFMFLFFVGCQHTNTNIAPKNTKVVFGVIKNVKFIHDASGPYSDYVYVILHFENKVVKLRSRSVDPIDIPINQPITITYYEEDLIIKKIEDSNDKPK